jgi:hypothetical protein
VRAHAVGGGGLSGSMTLAAHAMNAELAAVDWMALSTQQALERIVSLLIRKSLVPPHSMVEAAVVELATRKLRRERIVDYLTEHVTEQS